MKNLNKKVGIVVASVLFLAPVVSFADTELNDDITSTTMTSTTNTSNIFLKGKIEGYKVILSWGKYSSDTEILGYKIVVTNASGEEKTISVGSDKTTVDNWDARTGKNVYQLSVMGADGVLAESNEVVLNMGPNGGYDFGNTQGQYQKPNYNEQKTSYGSGLTEEQKTQIDYLKKSLEENLKSLRESITADNLEEIKAKAESLKTEYLAKADSLGLTEIKKMIEERFNMFASNQFTKRDEMKKYMDQKKEQFDNLKKQGQEQIEQKKGEMKQKMQDLKQNYKNAKVDLKVKYKQTFTKKLEGKLDAFSSDKLKAIITKIDTLIETYKANEKLTPEQKEKFTAQLQAVKEIIQDKIDETDNSINLDEILSQ